MSVLGYGRDEMLAVFLAKTYCLPILLYGCETRRMSSSDKHKLDVAWNNCFRKIFNACWRESAKPLTAVILLWHYACFITCRPEKNDF